jgi:hypothetical protein
MVRIVVSHAGCDGKLGFRRSCVGTFRGADWSMPQPVTTDRCVIHHCSAFAL